MKIPQTVIVGCMAMISFCSNGETVASLAQVKGRLKSQAHQVMFQEVMSGQPAPDRFGRLTPQDASFNRVAAWLMEPDTHPVFLGIKKWRFGTNLYLGIGCATVSKPRHPTYRAEACDVQKDTVTLRMLKRRSDGQFSPFTQRFEWDTQPLFDSDLVSDRQAPQLRGFDFAPYHLNDDQTAFGVRSAVFVGYAGGGAVTERLTLFALFNDKIKSILSVPVSYYENIAGDWHQDGTRSHDVYQQTKVVIMLKKMTHGVHQLKLKTLNSKDATLYFWNEKRQQYLEAR